MVSPSQNGHVHRTLTDFAQIPVTAREEYVEVLVPEWDTEEGPASVLLRRISQGERKRFTAQGELGLLSVMSEAEREQELSRWRTWFDSGARDCELLRMCYVRSDGRPLFTEAQVRELMERPDPRPWVRLIDAAERENLITLAAIQEFEKNVPATRSAGATGWPKPSASQTQTPSPLAPTSAGKPTTDRSPSGGSS